MKTAEQLLADLRSGGIELQTDGLRLRWRPVYLVPDPVARQIRGHKAELIELLRRGDSVVPRCPSCRWPLDSARRCPKCFDRVCVTCGRLTGSYFVQRCVTCGHALAESERG